MSGVYGFHHICINTPDIEKSIAFYQDLFGFNIVGRESCSFGEYAMLRLNDSRLELIQPNVQDENSFGDKGAITHIGLGVKGIDEVVAALREKGVRFLSEDINEEDAPMGGLRAISLLGPSQEHLNLYEFRRDF